MIFEVFSRVVFFLTSLVPGDIESSASLPLPNNLSLFHRQEYNDTVSIDNPFLYVGSIEGEDQFQEETLIKLPVCCSTIISGGGGGGGSGLCSNPDYEDNDDDEDEGNSNRDSKDFGNSTSTLSDYFDDKGKWSDWYPAAHLFPSPNRSHYRFEARMPTCMSSVSRLNVMKLSMDESKLASQGRFLRNGYFGFDNKEFFSPTEYCINGLTGEFVQVMICDSVFPNAAAASANANSLGFCSGSEGRPCIQKCCNPDEIYSFSRRECIKSKRGALFRPIFYRDLSHRLSESEQETVHPHYHIKFPRSFKYHCETNKTLILPSGEVFAEYLSNFTNRKYYSAHFKIREDGRIMYRKDGKAIVLPQGLPIYLKDNSRKCYTLKSSSHYCIDGAAEYGNPNPFNNDEAEIFLVTCSEYLFEPPNIGPLSFVYGNVMITSSLFSLLTVVVYIALPANIHRLTIASYAFSMFLMYTFLGLAHLIRYYWSDDVLKTASCVTIGIASHLFSMSSFLWLTLMNWDIWWTFRKFRPATTAHNNGGKQFRHFLTYSIFGWGLPIGITGVSTFLHFKYEESSEDDCAVVGVPLPAYGRESCEIKQLSIGVYLYFPAAILLAFNLLFFIVTTYRLCRHSIKTQIATRNLERHHQSVQLFAKLFFVMGVTRIFEVITWAGSGPTLTWYWAVFDIFNVLQAVAIFIIYVCKRDVLDSLRRILLEFYYRRIKTGRQTPLASSSTNNILSFTTSDGIKK